MHIFNIGEHWAKIRPNNELDCIQLSCQGDFDDRKLGRKHCLIKVPLFSNKFYIFYMTFLFTCFKCVFKRIKIKNKNTYSIHQYIKKNTEIPRGGQVAQPCPIVSGLSMSIPERELSRGVRTMIRGNGVPVIQTLVIRPTSADSWALSAVFPF